MTTNNPEIRALTFDEIDAVGGGEQSGPFYTTGNSVGIDIPGVFHLGFVNGGDQGIFVNLGLPGYQSSHRIY